MILKNQRRIEPLMRNFQNAVGTKENSRKIRVAFA